MASENDLYLAVMDIAQADTGAGGLVLLTGRSDPAQRWADWAKIENHPIPVVLITWFGSDGDQATPKTLEGNMRFDCVAADSDNGLEMVLLDRCTQIFNWTSFNGEGLDVSVREGSRRDTTELIRSGRRATVDLRMVLTR